MDKMMEEFENAYVKQDEDEVKLTSSSVNQSNVDPQNISNANLEEGIVVQLYEKEWQEITTHKENQVESIMEEEVGDQVEQNKELQQEEHEPFKPEVNSLIAIIDENSEKTTKEPPPKRMKKRPRTKKTVGKRKGKKQKKVEKGITATEMVKEKLEYVTRKSIKNMIANREVAALEVNTSSTDEKAAVRAGHLKFMKLVSELTEEKKQAVRNIGFGSLLSLDFPSSKLKFNASLLSCFDESSSSVMLPSNSKFEVTEEDVEIVLGLPRGGEVIEEFSASKYPQDFKDFLANWRLFWNLESHKGSPSINNIINRYTDENQLKNAAPDDNFIIDFVVCAVNCLMASKTCSQCNFKFLYSIMDLRRIPHLNWCKYVHQQLISTAREYKKKKQTFFKGPLCFLALCYFDRVKRLGIEQPRTVPLISTWTKKMIQERLKIEDEDGFGKGFVLDRVSRPVIVQNESHAPCEEPVPTTDTLHPQEEDINVKEFLDNFLGLLKNVGLHIKKISKMIAQAQVIFPNNSLAQITTQFLEKMVEKGQTHTSLPSKEDFNDDDFAEEFANIEKSIMDELERNKKTIVEKQDFDHRKPFNISIRFNSSPEKLQ